MEKQRKGMRQGDVLLVPIAQATGIRLPARNGRLIVAEGERSGHHHTLKRGAMLLNEEGLSISGDGADDLTHPEHSSLETDGDDYAVIQQRRADGGTSPRSAPGFD